MEYYFLRKINETERYLFGQNWYIKGLGFASRGEHPVKNFVKYPPPTGGSGKKKIYSKLNIILYSILE